MKFLISSQAFVSIHVVCVCVCDTNIESDEDVGVGQEMLSKTLNGIVRLRLYNTRLSLPGKAPVRPLQLLSMAYMC